MNIKNILVGLISRLAPIINSDKLFLRLRYCAEMGDKLDFDNCRTMNEKLQWLKINNRYPELTDCVDKIKVKKKVAEKIGAEYIVPTLKIWETAEELTANEIASLPDKFVIKTNHSGGNSGVVICNDKSRLDIKSTRDKMRRSLHSDIYRHYREWPYKNVERKIFAEKYLGDNITDYKFFCFNGYVDCVMLCLDRDSGDTKFYFFDQDWNLKRLNVRGKNAPEGFTLPKPEGMDEMFRIAGILSEGFPYVRVDLYNVAGKIYFGELTFYPASGFDANLLSETDDYFGSLIDLKLARNEE